MPPLQGKHPDRIGDESEANIIAHLMQAGYDILLPFGKNHRYDLIIEDAEGKFWTPKNTLKLLDENGQVWYH